MMTTEKQLDFLRRQHRLGTAAAKILDYFASRKRHTRPTYVSRTATQSGVSEDEVKDFFKDLAQQEFGRYIKSSRGYPARFEWGTTDESYQHDYSLIAVGRAAQGLSETLDDYFTNPAGGVAEDDLEDENAHCAGEEDSQQTVTLRAKFRGKKIRIELPIDFDPTTDADELRDLIVMLFKHEKPVG